MLRKWVRSWMPPHGDDHEETADWARRVIVLGAGIYVAVILILAGKFL